MPSWVTRFTNLSLQRKAPGFGKHLYDLTTINITETIIYRHVLEDLFAHVELNFKNDFQIISKGCKTSYSYKKSKLECMSCRWR